MTRPTERTCQWLTAHDSLFTFPISTFPFLAFLRQVTFLNSCALLRLLVRWTQTWKWMPQSTKLAREKKVIYQALQPAEKTQPEGFFKSILRINYLNLKIPTWNKPIAGAKTRHINIRNPSENFQVPELLVLTVNPIIAWGLFVFE